MKLANLVTTTVDALRNATGLAPASLDEQQTLAIGREQLGTIQTLKHRGRDIRYKLPDDLNDRLTLRFRGHGRTRNGESGDLLLHIILDRGRDLRGALWLSESEATAGCRKRVSCEEQCHFAVVPPRCKDGQVLRLKGHGAVSDSGKQRTTPARGDSYITLHVFADQVVPRVSSVEAMSIEDLWLEGWIYRRTDEVLGLLRKSPFSVPPFTAVRAAELFSEMGWEAIGAALIWHLGLQHAQVRFESSPTLDKPGRCFTEVTTRNNQPDGIAKYTISIHSQFLDNPFAVTAILAHEFCHILEARHFGGGRTTLNPTGNELMELERTVDLLVFLFGLGEFQMRVARQNHTTLGYFKQDLFERMHLIWSRKQKEFLARHGTPE